ncbi:Proepiregulin [Varanus komodoensis]|nr:Proepiregulin [Varanus komodoensis]
MAGWSARRSTCALLFLERIQEVSHPLYLYINPTLFFSVGLHLSQAVLGTTVIPLCGSNETDRCTTNLVQTKATTQAAEVVVTSCQSGMQNYCFNGQCVYIVDLKQHYCKCKAGYVGVRCGHSNLELVHRPLNNEYLALTILMVLFIFLAVSVGIYFSYRWYENKKQRHAANRNYEQVATNTGLLHV